ncbi:MAG: molybdopterin molybdotransferase MoeA, partial [Pseudomonadota bacterium]
MSRLLSVADALSRILADTCPLSAEDVAIEDAAGRILASDLTARRDQPAFDASAMDGYALRSADVHGVPTNLTLVGESAAGHPFTGTVSRGQCVRIFTGARLPKGADTIAIQENVRANGTDISIDKAERPGRYIRRAGLDYRAGDVLLRDSMKLSPARLSLAASMGLPALPVRRKPKVAIIASGDELVAPGEDVPEGGIVSSNNLGIAAIIRAAGGAPLDLGIAPDTREALAEKFVLAADCHIVVTSGGASVGDHDLVRPVLEEHGVKLDFWKIAMRPGKP